MRKRISVVIIVGLVTTGGAVSASGGVSERAAKPVVPCWTGLPTTGGEARLKVAPNACLFVKPGARALVETVAMRSLNWKHWGAPHARGNGEVCAAGCTRATVILSKLRHRDRCDGRAYGKATFKVPGVAGAGGGFRLAGC